MTTHSTSVPLAVPDIGEAEAAYLHKCVESGFVSSVGPFVSEFEKSFAERVGARYAVACSSGTAALHVAMRLLGVGPGDEVAVSDFTFIASANAIAYEGATPLLVDSEPATWNLDADVLVDEIQRRLRTGARLPAAVEVVHVLGQPARLDTLLEMCAEHGIALVEDAAEALGASWSAGALAGRQVGTAGSIGVFSFNGNKIMTTGSGGMLVTDDPELARRAKHLTTQAKVPDVGYLHDEIGFNYRLTNVHAALGLAQLSRLTAFVDAKRRIAARYDAALADVGLELPPRLPGLDSTYWLYSVLAPAAVGQVGRDRMLQALERRGVQARSLWRPLHLQPPLRTSPVLGGGVSESLFSRGFSLPCSTSLDDATQDRVIDAVRGAVAESW